MALRVESNQHTPLKSTMRKLSWTQAAKYGVLHDQKNKKVHMADVKQDGDTLTIIKRIDTTKNWLYMMGWPKKGFYERVIVNRKDQTVAIDSFEAYYFIESGPYMCTRDLFFHREDSPNKLFLVRHMYWINQFKRYYHMFWFGAKSWNLKRKIKGF